MPLTFGSYFVRFAAAAVAMVLLAWVYALTLPMAFLPGGYPYWAAKSEMLHRCDLGQIAFFGDSRIESGVIPAMLPVPASNFGVAGGTPVEAASAVRRALACPVPPRQAVLAVTAEHFGPLSQFFWNGTLRYGFLPLSELWDDKRLAASLGDDRTFNTSPIPADFPPGLRDWMYGIRFPSIYFSNLVQGRLFGRWSENRARLAEALAAHGHFDHVLGEGEREPAYDTFRPTKLNAALFENAVRSLSDRGVAVGLLVMPVSPNGQPAAALEQAYVAYLQGLAERIPHVSVIGGGMPHWPQAVFSDDFHMVGAGAEAFTGRLAACVREGTIQPDCDLSWHGKQVTQAQ